MRGLKIWTFRLAIWARRRRRISSSLLPLNMLPATTSIQPAPARWATSTSDLLQVLAGLRADTQDVADADKRRHLRPESRLERRRLDLCAGRGAVDPGNGVDDLQLHGHR